MSKGDLLRHQCIVEILSRDINVRRGRGRPKLIWGEAIKRDLKG